jgi:hypothetical protein
MTGEGIRYTFTGQPWKHDGQAGWYFVSLPKELAREIRENLRWQEEGWGRLKATAQIGNSTWKTAIWFDTKMHTYLLPLKAEIRKKAFIAIGKSIEVTVWV